MDFFRLYERWRTCRTRWDFVLAVFLNFLCLMHYMAPWRPTWESVISRLYRIPFKNPRLTDWEIRSIEKRKKKTKILTTQGNLWHNILSIKHWLVWYKNTSFLRSVCHTKHPYRWRLKKIDAASVIRPEPY